MSEASEKHPRLIRWWMWPVLIAFVLGECYLFSLGREGIVYALLGVVFFVCVAVARWDYAIPCPDGKPYRGFGALCLSLFKLGLVLALPAFLTFAMLTAEGHPRSVMDCVGCYGNMESLGFGIRSHATDDEMPPTFIVDENGDRLVSWRLAAMSQTEIRFWLYNTSRVTSAWDSDVAMRRWSEVELYNTACPASPNYDRRNPGPTTNYLAVTGPSTAWPEDGTARRFGDIADPSRTALVIEYPKSDIHFAEPRDMPLTDLTSGKVPWSDLNAHPRKGGSFYYDTPGTHVLFADGDVKWIGGVLTPDQIEELFSIDSKKTLEELGICSPHDLPRIPRYDALLVLRIWQTCVLILTGSLVHSLCGIARRKRL